MLKYLWSGTYDAQLPFYQRAFASGLAYSLGVSLDKQLSIDLKSKKRALNNSSY